MIISNIGQLVTGELQNGRLVFHENVSVEVQEQTIVRIIHDATPKEDRHSVDAEGGVVTPGLIDCHTHGVFAGDRGEEFALRAQGASYLELAKQGMGIQSTVNATREASFEDLLALAGHRFAHMLSQGVTTCEVKSGYGLNLESELKLLRVVKELDETLPISLVPTFLGAHTIPKGVDGNTYVNELCETMIPTVAAEKLATAVDVYCEESAFSLEQSCKIWECALAHDLNIKGHVGQFTNLGAATYLADKGALSCDHLEHTSQEDFEKMAAHETVAVLLPVASEQLGQAPPAVDKMRRSGVKMAVATDLNPGTAYCESLRVAMWLAVVRYGLTVDEVVAAVTSHAAQALGLTDRGLIKPGFRADMAIWHCKHVANLPYQISTPLLKTVICGGNKIPSTIV